MSGSGPQSPVAGVAGDQVVAGRYVIASVVGEGAFGTVYDAVDREAGGRRVALKVLHPELAGNEEARARFEREARAASMLRHPNGVEVLGVGCDGELHFIVMEFVDGESLDEALEHGPLHSLEEVVRIASQVCGALTAAHARGIVHRDIKPGNILLARADDGELVVKLCDFGVARLRPGLDGGGSKRPLTSLGQVLGTPAYLAPEQARGDQLDHRCDLYALGVVLFEMTTGVLPFFADSPHAVLAQHLTQPPPRPSSLDPDYPLALERIVLRCLAKDPAARFPNASVLQGELEALLYDPEVHSWSSAMLPAIKPAQRGEHDEVRDTDNSLREPAAVRRTLEAGAEPQSPNTGDGPAIDAFHVNRTDPRLRALAATSADYAVVDEPERPRLPLQLAMLAVALVALGLVLWLAAR